MKAHAMSCQTCEELLTDYKDAVGLFKNAVHNDEVAPVGDYLPAARRAARVLAAERAARWGLLCKYASDALIEHWRKEHSSLAAKAGSS